MSHRTPPFLRALLLLILAVGPLQAQSAFACAMMDTVVLDECCCDEHEPGDHCKNAHCDSLPEPADEPCCDRSLEVGLDQEAGQTIPLAKLTDLHSDVDPPQTAISSFDALFLPHPRPIHGNDHYPPVAGQSGSDTYLLTQRLRI